MVTSLSDLPTEILPIICEKLVDVIDYARFGAVCKSWRDIVWRLRAKIPPDQLPILMFPNFSYNNSTWRHSHSFYSLSVGKKLIINNEVSSLKQFRNCFGSSHGWLITVDYWNKFQLLNPFQSDNNVIKLPSLEPPQSTSVEILKAVLSHNPSQTSQYVVMLSLQVIYQLSSGYILAFLKPGESYWTSVSCKEFKSLTDIVYYEDRFYAISWSGEIVFCDINSTQPSLQRVAPLPIPNMNNGSMVLITDGGESCYVGKHASLVESSGDLICVVRKFKADLSECLSWTDGFQIFKLQTKILNWIELNTLGGHALFIGNGDSTSLLASDFRHCKANHIYFTHYDSRCRLDVGVFNLPYASFQTLHSEYMCQNAIVPLWVQPTLNMVKNY